MTNKTKSRILNAISCILVAVMLFSAYKIYTIYDGYKKEDVIHTEVNEFNPNLLLQESEDDTASEKDDTTENTSSQGQAEPKPSVSRVISELKATYPDAIGWITVNNSKVDYPFVQADDNDKYLNRAIDGSSLKAGTIFMDCRNSADMSDFTSILYGHHMKNGSMFGSLSKFKSESTFKKCTGGKLFLENDVHELVPLAYMVISHDDEIIYRSDYNSDEKKTEFLDYVKTEAIHYNDCSPTIDDKFLILSTCNYTFENARSVVIFKVKSNEE